MFTSWLGGGCVVVCVWGGGGGGGGGGGVSSWVARSEDDARSADLASVPVRQ